MDNARLVLPTSVLQIPLTFEDFHYFCILFYSFMPANPDLAVSWGNPSLYRNKPEEKAYITRLVETYRDTPSSAASAIIL